MIYRMSKTLYRTIQERCNKTNPQSVTNEAVTQVVNKEFNLKDLVKEVVTY